MIASFGAVLEYRVAYTGSRATVTLVYGDPVKKTRRGGKRRRAPGAVQEDPKLAAQPPVAGPSASPPPPSPPKRTPVPSTPASPDEPYSNLDTAMCQGTMAVPPTSTPRMPIPVTRSTIPIAPIRVGTGTRCCCGGETEGDITDHPTSQD
ncbi:4-O-methyl-glucuronoyl methylesterase 1-like [Gigantopelta aegis]|uniref:4-O-methyl-glucuronoyl methylesterase 1-like n=1 Tax=Gigantopelta aegis TaxID=1735272 RepID=UPI001B887C4E|nr:4-O-methyl-glucuronoyl methylesterase 1-like [Gigantopelta aegis]